MCLGFERSQFRINVEHSWSPLGVDRLLELVRSDFFTDMVMYRVLPGFLIQFGVASDPKVQERWQTATIKDEPNQRPFQRGTVSFAGAGTDSRSCHIFVALDPNGRQLGHSPHETTLGYVENMEAFEQVADNFQAAGYGDTGELQQALVQLGNRAADQYPRLDRIHNCSVAW